MKVHVIFEVEKLLDISDDEVIEAVGRSLYYLPGHSKYWIDNTKTKVTKGNV